MGLLAHLVRARERFCGFEISVHPLPPPFEVVPASIRRLASHRTHPPRQPSRGLTPAYAITLLPSTIINQATNAGAHGKSTCKHGTLRVRVDHPYARLRQQTTAIGASHSIKATNHGNMVITLD